MSTEATPKGKGGRAPANSNNDEDSIMPLLFATIGNPSISFKKMAAMDDLGRTESSLEHKFRKWRQKGREIAAENPEHAGSLGGASAGAATSKKPRTPSKTAASGKGKGLAKQVDVDDDEDMIHVKGEKTEQEPNETNEIGREMLSHSTKGRTMTNNGTKKRATSESADAAERDGGRAPSKKTKMVKKGTAKVVKRPKSKMISESEDEDVASEVEGKISDKPKGKDKGNGAAAGSKAKASTKSTGPAKAKKGKTGVSAKAGEVLIHENEDADVDMSGGDNHDGGMIEMQFDEAA